MSEPSLSQAIPTTMQPSEHRKARPARRRLPSVRVVITLIVVVPIALVAAALIAIASITSRAIAEDLGQELVANATNTVVFDVKTYLDAAMRVSELYTRKIVANELPADNLASWDKTLIDDLATNPDIASICFATPKGDCTWLLRGYDGLEWGIVSGNAKDQTAEYRTKPDGTIDRTRAIRGRYTYDATARPWFAEALKHTEPTWTPIYQWFKSDREQNANVMGTGYTRAIHNADGTLKGVLVIDVTLGALSTYLKEISRAVGFVFVVDDKGLLVAASDGDVASPQGRQLSPSEAKNPAARAMAQLVTEDRVGEGTSAAPVSRGRIFIDGEPARAQVTEIKPFPGIHWHVVTVLPESYFLSQARSLQNRAILMALGALLGAAALGLLMSRKLSDPLLRLTEHVARVGSGDFNSRLELSNASELRKLSDELNRMAGGLKDRMMLQQSLAMAEQVQQALLPAVMPTLKGLELAACSKYCDSTGGDYFDFIEMPGIGEGKALIAVGDVTGHGIGAALLMSTARGAARAASHGAPSLGHILTRINTVLSGSAQQGMFMTLALLMVDPETRYIHWASGGHDPTIVYHPETDTFEELDSGDVPLGIDADVVYREFSRLSATPGTIMVIGTDGIWEARGEDGIMFGKARLREVIRENHGSAEELSAAIKSTMYNYVGDQPLRDDVTFVVVKVKQS